MVLALSRSIHGFTPSYNVASVIASMRNIKPVSIGTVLGTCLLSAFLSYNGILTQYMTLFHVATVKGSKSVFNHTLNQVQSKLKGAVHN